MSEINSRKYEANGQNCDSQNKVLLKVGEEEDKQQSHSLLIYFGFVFPVILALMVVIVDGAEELSLYNFLVIVHELLYFLFHVEDQL